MTDYKKMYLKLFNNVTDAIRILQDAQIATEEMYIEAVGAEDEKKTSTLELPFIRIL